MLDSCIAPIVVTDSDEESVRAVLSEFGEVAMVTLPRNKETGKPRGFVFVDMATKEEMEAAIEGVNGRLLNGRVLRASPSLPKAAPMPPARPS